MNKDKRFIQSEKAIIEAGIQTLLGNSSAAMSEIATNAGIGRATLYRHFDSREALIEKIILLCIEELEKVVAPFQTLSGREALEAGIEAVMPLADRFHFLTTLWPMVAERDVIQQLDTELINANAILIEQAKEAGEIDPALPTVWISSFYDSALATAWSLIAEGDVTIDEAVAYAKQSFFQGCGISDSQKN